MQDDEVKDLNDFGMHLDEELSDEDGAIPKPDLEGEEEEEEDDEEEEEEEEVM